MQRMRSVHAASTNKGCDSQWRLFEHWCVKRGHDLVAATSVLVGKFFLYLFHDRKLQVRSTLGYKSALTFYLKRASECDLLECEILKNVIKGFRRERPPPQRTDVAWDVATVLQYLSSAPFAAATCSNRHLTYKAVFLFFLASGRRCSEVHALLRSTVRFAPDLSSVTIKPHPRFISKTHLSSRGVGALTTITIPALRDADDAPLHLCPVRWLKHYVTRSDTYRAPSRIDFS